MRVAISALSVKPGQTGGGETVLRNLSRYLPPADPDIEYLLFVSWQNRRLFDWEASNVSLEVVPEWVCSPLRRVVYEMCVLPYRLQHRKVDLFLAINQVFSPLLPCPAVSLVQNLLYYHYREFYQNISLGFGARLGLEARNLYFSLLNGLSVRRAVQVVAISETGRREIVSRERIPPEKVAVVPLAVSTDIDPRRATSTPNLDLVRSQIPGPFLLSVGTLEPYKNLDQVIAGLALLRQERGMEDVCLVLIGLNVHNYERILYQFAEEIGVADSVYFLGPLPHAELGAWYQAAKVFVVLSGCEAFSLPPLEAMTWGTPVIASNLSAVSEVVGEGGLLVDPYDVEQVVGRRITRVRIGALPVEQRE